MNLKQTIGIFLISLTVGFGYAQEKKIKFNRGTLKICSSKNFQITGYDGNEVIIKNVSGKKASAFYRVNGYSSGSYSYSINGKRTNGLGQVGKLSKTKKDTAKLANIYFLNRDGNRKKGLKKLGKNADNAELGIYFEIEEKDGELIFRDKRSNYNQLVMVRGEKYEVKIPNSIKLNWTTEECGNKPNRNNNYVFFTSDASTLSNFSGEVELITSMHNIKFVDVTGPVSVNSLGGNFTVEFDKKRPTKLYSIYSNNGFIDMTLPKNSSLSVDATGKSVYSDLDFKVLSEKEINDFGHTMQQMKLKLNSGSVKMKLDAGYGNVYLREKQ